MTSCQMESPSPLLGSSEEKPTSFLPSSSPSKEKESKTEPKQEQETLLQFMRRLNSIKKNIAPIVYYFGAQGHADSIIHPEDQNRIITDMQKDIPSIKISRSFHDPAKSYYSVRSILYDKDNVYYVYENNPGKASSPPQWFVSKYPRDH